MCTVCDRTVSWSKERQYESVSDCKETNYSSTTTRSRGTSWHTARAVVASFLMTDRSIDRSIDWMDGSLLMVVVEKELLLVAAVDFGNRNKCCYCDSKKYA
jgi:hypothetical protein